MSLINWYTEKPNSFNYRAGHEHFRKGNYRQGFKLYARSSNEGFFGRLPSLKRLQEKGVIITLSGGFGDIIQFLRFAKTLSGLGVVVNILVQEKYDPLKELINQQDYLNTVEEPVADIPTVNLMRLPYLLGIDLKNLPAEQYLYLKKDERYYSIKKAVESFTGFKIGIQHTCGKSVDSNKDRGRNIDISLLRQLSNRDSICFFNLDRDNFDSTGNGVEVINIGSKRSFLDSANIMRNVDLVISVDTAMCHLAGALHVPVWTLLPQPCSSWRWYQHETRTFWYPTMRLFRQRISDDWTKPLSEINKSLTVMIDDKMTS